MRLGGARLDATEGSRAAAADLHGCAELDCEDIDCRGSPACGVQDCRHGLDGDGDGATDRDDPNCATDPACLAEDCAKGVDDEGDEGVDCDDTDCPCDLDMDGVVDSLDCAPNDAGAFAVPVEVRQLRLRRLGLPPEAVQLSWRDDRATTGVDTLFEVAAERLSALRAGRVADGPCVATASVPSYDDAAPLGGEGRYYLVRAINVCGPAAGLEWGAGSTGQARPACP